MKTSILVTLLLFPIFLLSQRNEKILLKVGFGTSILGSGDASILQIESEVVYNLNYFVSIAGGITQGGNYSNWNDSFAYLGKVNGNLVLSPFGNKRIYNLAFGGGVSYYYSYINYGNSIVFVGGERKEFEHFNAVGLNLFVDQTIRVWKKHHVTLGVFITPFIDGNINSGISMKYGYRL